MELVNIPICFPFPASCVFPLCHYGLYLLPSAPAVPVRSTNSGAELVSGMRWCQILLMPVSRRMEDHNLSWFLGFLGLLFYMCVCIHVCVLCASKVQFKSKEKPGAV